MFIDAAAAAEQRDEIVHSIGRAVFDLPQARPD
jgi:hypothetical protein